MTTELAKDIIAMRLKGMTYSQIQSALGCSKGTISYYLGEGQVEKRQERQRRIRNTVNDFLKEVKQNSACADCGEGYPYWIMEFDHLPEHTKEFNLSKWSEHSASLDKVKSEVAKCEVVCANCHRNRTYVRARNSGNGGYQSALDISERY